MQLPSEKAQPTITPATAKMIVYGAPGVGKTTLGATLNPDHTLILATEPGTGGLEAYVQPIGSWKDFLDAGAALAKDGHHFTQVVIDTADELQRMCQEYVIAAYNEGKAPTHRITHPSDLEYGKGWDALSREWRRIAGFCQAFGGGVMFTSHEKHEKFEKPVGSVDRAMPTLTGAAAKWLNGYVEFILHAAIVDSGTDKERRVIHANPSELWVAKRRILEGRTWPHEIPLDAKALRKTMYDATKPAKTPAKKKANNDAVAEPAAA